MRAAHIDCFSGLAGDMFLGALLDAGLPLEQLESGLEPLGLGTDFHLEVEKVTRCGLAATRVRVVVHGASGPREEQAGDARLADPGHHGHSVAWVLERLGRAPLGPEASRRARGAFERLARAEADRHGLPIERVHLHEVGAVDAIVDIAGAAYGLEALGVERVTSGGAVCGTGEVRAAHGPLPVPAPATLALLEGIPVRGLPIAHELTTPTGAAILAAFCDGHGVFPAGVLRAVGYGAGAKDLEERANVCRVSLLDVEATGPGPQAGGDATPTTACLLSANLDDLTPELAAHAAERLLRAGALDVWTVPATMKRGRPALVLHALCAPADRPAIERCFFEETTTFGVRRQRVERTVLAREEESVETHLGPVQVKVGRLEGRVVSATPELRSCEALAQRTGVPLRQVYRLAAAAAARLGGQSAVS